MLNAFRHWILVRLLRFYGVRSRGVVLNAFRHWILVRSGGSGRRIQTRRAQRLSALDLGSPVRGLRRRQPQDACSTPFGIGSWFAAVEGAVHEGEAPVLNAFRHWILVRASRAVGSLGGAVVLNAFRHWILVRPRSHCIGPRGAQVLNAFRHWILVREAVGTGVTPPPECSTPFGIGSWFATSRLQGHRLRSGAQRLSALDLGSPRGRRGRVWSGCGAQRLSALDLGSPPALSLHSPARRASAQRLSALDLGSPYRGSATLWSALTCSTPFGIGSWFAGQRSPPAAHHHAVLNAFRHWILVRSVMRVAAGSMLGACSTPFGIGSWFAARLRKAVSTGVRESEFMHLLP